MYSWGLRLNTALTLGAAVLAILCTMASVTDMLHHPSPQVQLEVVKTGPLQRLTNGEDRNVGLGKRKEHGCVDTEVKKIKLLLNITVDLESVFTWNTKQLFVFIVAEYTSPERGFNQVTLWDTIIEKKEDAKIQQLVLTQEVFKTQRDGPFTYSFQGKHLQGLKFNLTMYWNLMALSGALLTDKVVIPGFQLPEQYS